MEKQTKTGHPNSMNHNIMAFPNGPICNLNCEYCYYLDKTKLYPEEKSFQMGYGILEEYTKQYLAAQSGPIVNFGWQGGEPTLRGIDFFHKAVELQEKYLPETKQVQNSFQTNGVLLNDEWCQFFQEHNFLVGVSLDGSQRLHDAYRKDKSGNPTYDRVVAGIRLLQKYNVDYNILCAVNDFNSQFPLEVYKSIKELGVGFMQFIPIVQVNEQGRVGKHSVTPEGYGRFLIAIFDQWVKEDYGKIYVQIFEEAVRAWAGVGCGLCVFSKTCGTAPVMEFNGDVYACDHFVSPTYKLGNIKEKPLVDLVNTQKQIQFGQNKYDTLPQVCLDCPANFVCHGGCPKNRIGDPTGEGQRLNYLCGAYRQFFTYIDPYMHEIAAGIKDNLSPVSVKNKLIQIQDRMWNLGRNDPCPCGSGKKYKKCCIQRWTPHA